MCLQLCGDSGEGEVMSLKRVNKKKEDILVEKETDFSVKGCNGLESVKTKDHFDNLEKLTVLSLD